MTEEEEARLPFLAGLLLDHSEEATNRDWQRTGPLCSLRLWRCLAPAYSKGTDSSVSPISLSFSLSLSHTRTLSPPLSSSRFLPLSIAPTCFSFPSNSLCTLSFGEREDNKKETDALTKRRLQP
jgi:hypothetical protein